MKAVILTIALILALGYIVSDYFIHPTQPALDEETELSWLICGMDMQVLEQDLKIEITDETRPKNTN